MAYQFSNQQKANAVITNQDDTTYKIAGVNGKQTSADNFQTAITGLLNIVGKQSMTSGTGRTITQDVEEVSP